MVVWEALHFPLPGAHGLQLRLPVGARLSPTIHPTTWGNTQCSLPPARGHFVRLVAVSRRGERTAAERGDVRQALRAQPQREQGWQGPTVRRHPRLRPRPHLTGSSGMSPAKTRSYSPGEGQPHPTSVLMEDRRGPGRDVATPDAGRGRRDPPQSPAWISDLSFQNAGGQTPLLSAPKSVVIVSATPVGLRDHTPLLMGPTTPVRSRPEGPPCQNLPCTQPPRRPQCPLPPAVPQRSFPSMQKFRPELPQPR